MTAQRAGEVTEVEGPRGTISGEHYLAPCS
jgi:hypothetical protein